MCVGFGRDCIVEIWPIKPFDKTCGSGECAAIDDLFARDLICGVREGRAWHAGKAVVQYVQAEVVLAKIVAP